MNAERLHAIALAIQGDLAETQEVSILEGLSQALASQRDEPAQPSHGVQVGNYRKQLEGALATAPSNNFPPAWRQSLVDLGVAGLLGNDLLRHIHEIFARNEITIAAAAEEVTELCERATTLTGSLDSLLTGFTAFNIGAEELGPGEFEIGFLIPRDAVRSEFGPLGKEFTEINKEILGPIVELATGTREAVKVKAISSSDFQAFLVAAPEVARLVSEILANLLASYEKYREIREHATALEGKVPEHVIAPMRTHATEGMQLDIQALAEQLIAEYGANLRAEGRDHEMTVSIQHSLTQTARRIDEGYKIDVRSYTLPPAAEDQDEGVLPAGATPETEDVRRIIEERQPRLQAMNLSGVPILELPVGEADDDATAGDEEPA